MTNAGLAKSVALHFLVLLFAVVLMSVLCRPANAQDDPPDRVARLNYMQGSVSFQPAGTQDWVDASPNRPLTTGDNLWTDQNSSGELHIGSTALRLSSQTGISFLNLNDQATQIQLAQGSLIVHVRQLDDNESFEVDTPNLAFSILRAGDYRLSVDPNGSSSVIDVRAGSGEVSGGGQAFTLDPGQQYSFSGTDQLEYDAHALPVPDNFDNWSYSRDQREDQSVSARYVSREVTGYEDLDSYGSWRNNPEYGPVWFPSVEAGWAPYHNGHWVSVAPWGWTWVEDEPWGFAPFHYGRWAVIGGTWGWVPGPVAVGIVVGGPVVRPVYAPALVGFVGGGGFSATLVIGVGAGIAWFPLGPRDVWVPRYHCSPAYVQNVNIRNTRVVNVTQVTNIYNNVYVNHNTTIVNNYTYAQNVHAVTAVSRDTFVNGRPVARSSVQISRQQIQHPQINRQAASIQPTRQSRIGPQAAARALPPAALANRTVVTRMVPAPQAVPIGHTQSFATSRAAFRPAVGPGAANRPIAQPIRPNTKSSPVNGNYNRNTTTQPNNVARPGFQQPARNNPNTGANPNANTNTNAEPSVVRPGFQPPRNNTRNNENNGVNSNMPPNNGARPTFQPPTRSNANRSPNAQPNTAQPAFQPPVRNNTNPNSNGNSIQPGNSPRPTFRPPQRNNNTTIPGGNDNQRVRSNNTAHPAFQPPPQHQNPSVVQPPRNNQRPAERRQAPPPNPPKAEEKNKDGKDKKDNHP